MCLNILPNANVFCWYIQVSSIHKAWNMKSPFCNLLGPVWTGANITWAFCRIYLKLLYGFSPYIQQGHGNICCRHRWAYLSNINTFHYWWKLKDTALLTSPAEGFAIWLFNYYMFAESANWADSVLGSRFPDVVCLCAIRCIF